MFRPENFDDATLRKLIVNAGAGQVIFSQNEKGNTMYLILDGFIKITHRTTQRERVLEILGAGEVFGERAICQEGVQKRNINALAVTDATLLAFDSQALKYLQTKLPDFGLKILSVVCNRLEKANELISVIQLPEPLERITEYVKFLCKHSATSTGGQLEIEVTEEQISIEANVPQELVKSALSELIHEKVLTISGNKYLIANESALEQALPALKERLAA